MDIKVDPNSTPTSGGQYGYFELKRSDGTAIGGVNLTSTTWTTITLPLPATEGEITGIIVQNGNGAFQGPVTYYLDNLLFTQRSGEVTRPKLAFEKRGAPGLKLIASAPNEDYQRQNLVYVPSEDYNNGLWWYNQQEPVTYSVTWADFPDRNAYRGFQGHIMLVPDTGAATANPAPDWTDPSAIVVEFQWVNTDGPDGTNGTADDVVQARARFMHKVNEPNANGMLYRGAQHAGTAGGRLGRGVRGQHARHVEPYVQEQYGGRVDLSR